MPQNMGRTIIKVVFWSLVIGLLLAAFDIEPKALLAGLGETAQGIFEIVAGFVEWTVPYILLGAVVVIPIWLITKVVGIARKKTGK